MQKTLIVTVLLAAVALAGCAGNNGTGDTNTTTTPGTTTTPVTSTPTTTTPIVPTNETPGGGMPEPDPRCLAPPADALANATGGNASTRLGMPELRFTARDPTATDPCYRFLGPQNATSGWNVLTLTYGQGQTFHIMPTYFIGNRTTADVMTAMANASEDEGFPEWATPAGGVGGVTGGQTGSVAMDLQPGNYFYFCPIEGHMFRGMMGMLTVTQAANESAAPQADATISLVDYNFTLPSDIQEAFDVIRVTNNGTEEHEAPLVKLNAGTNLTTFLGTLEDPNATGPPPGALVGGVNAIAPGMTVYLLPDLEAGRSYGFVCFVSSEKHGGAPHVQLGMVAQFEV